MSAETWWQRPRTISVVVDTPGWFDPFAERLVESLSEAGDDAGLYRSSADVPEGAIAFYLSCTRLVANDVLARNRLNVVVHASDLPRGRGFSPIVWQILEGRSEIPITAIVAAEGADTGDVLMRSSLSFEGHELNDVLRDRLGEEILRMCLALVNSPAPPEATPQVGEPTWYRRRGPEDSRLDPTQSIEQQFELLRVVDNERYPAFFELRGRRFALKIEDVGPAEDVS